MYAFGADNTAYAKLIEAGRTVFHAPLPLIQQMHISGSDSRFTVNNNSTNYLRVTFFGSKLGRDHSGTEYLGMTVSPGESESIHLAPGDYEISGKAARDPGFYGKTRCDGGTRYVMSYGIADPKQ